MRFSTHFDASESGTGIRAGLSVCIQHSNVGQIKIAYIRKHLGYCFRCFFNNFWFSMKKCKVGTIICFYFQLATSWEQVSFNLRNSYKFPASKMLYPLHRGMHTMFFCGAFKVFLQQSRPSQLTCICFQKCCNITVLKTCGIIVPIFHIENTNL